MRPSLLRTPTEIGSRIKRVIAGGIRLLPNAHAGRLAEIAATAERHGFDRLWLMDEGLAARDVYVTLALMARETHRIELGTGITNPYTRHPGVAAGAIASLDEISGGRAFLGIGAGGSLTLDPLGISRTRPLAAVREMVEITRALLQGSRVDYQGETLHLRKAKLDFARPDIEIWIAARGPRMLELAGGIADGVALSFIHEDLIRDVLRTVRAGAAATGNRPRISFSTMIVTSGGVLERVRPYLTYSLIDSPPAAKELLGISTDEVADIRRAMAEEGLRAAGRMLKEEWIRPFVLMGSIAECAGKLESLIKVHNLDEVMVPIVELEHAEKEMRAFADLISSLRSRI